MTDISRKYLYRVSINDYKSKQVMEAYRLSLYVYFTKCSRTRDKPHTHLYNWLPKCFISYVFLKINKFIVVKHHSKCWNCSPFWSFLLFLTFKNVLQHSFRQCFRAIVQLHVELLTAVTILSNWELGFTITVQYHFVLGAQI